MRTFFTFSRQPLRMQWSTLGGFNLGCRRGDRDPQGRRQVSRAHHSQSGSSGAWRPQSKQGDKREAVTRNVTVFTDCSSPACLLKFSDWEQCAGESSPTPGQKERALLLDFAVKKRRKPALPTDLHPAASQASSLRQSWLHPPCFKSLLLLLLSHFSDWADLLLLLSHFSRVRLCATP